MMVRISNPDITVAEGKTTINILSDGYYYVRHQGCDASTLTFRINGAAATKYSKATHKYLFEIGECKKGDVVTISNSASDSVDFYVYKMNLESVDQAYETLSKQTMVTEEFTDTYIKGYIDVVEEGRLIFSVPDEGGWSLYVDGVEQDIEYFKDTFVSVHLEEGHHTIELRYMTPGLGVGALITVTCVLLFIATMLVRGELEKRKGKLEETSVVIEEKAMLADAHTNEENIEIIEVNSEQEIN